MTKIFSAIFLIVITFTAKGQTTEKNRRTAVEELIETYISVSIDPYRGTTKAAWDKQAEELLNRIDNATGSDEFYYTLRYFGTLSNDGHFNFPDMGSYNRNKFFQKDDKLFPVLTRATQDDHVFVVRDYSGLIPDYAELIQINGKNVKELSHQQHILLPYEPNYAYAHLNEVEELSFRAWPSFANYLFCEKIQGPFTVEYAIDGITKTATINAMERQELHKKSKSMRKFNFPFYGKVIDYTRHNDSIAVLDIDSFWGKNPFMFLFSKNDKRFERTLKRNMKKVNRDGIRHLVVDIRSNAGGYAKNVYELMSYFAPDMVYDNRQTYKISAMSKEKDRGARIVNNSIQMIHGKNNKELREQTVEIYKSMPEGAIFRDDTLLSMAYSVEKPKYSYQGNVYVLTNSTSFSASTIFCNYFRKSGVGMIAGSSPAGYSKVTGGARIPARHWLTQFFPMRIPHILNNPLQEEGYQYIVPDIPIENDFDYWVKGEDNRLAKLLHMIASPQYDTPDN
ncbi:hypothetical protein LJB85_02715 [Porphyromonadaceae bacterium OttesenSCG-928-L07]|nr:hypothetical protein [Porphyromonadaceae bacterium OttesenSCG-928-L07]MDL2251935.1 hypothetical protein [Odoribacter sp. OttesenSCG-928-J03]